jgi:hypothetical protein
MNKINPPYVTFEQVEWLNFIITKNNEKRI